MKTKITAISHSTVEITFLPFMADTPVTWTIWANRGGYVMYEEDGCRSKQLCDRMHCMGSTLSWSGRRPIIELVRHEYRAMRREEARQQY